VYKSVGCVSGFGEYVESALIPRNHEPGAVGGTCPKGAKYKHGNRCRTRTISEEPVKQRKAIGDVNIAGGETTAEPTERMQSLAYSLGSTRTKVVSR